MARVLAYTSPATGHLYPLCAVLAELAARGHHIALRTLRSGVQTGLDLGFATTPIDARIEAITLDDWQAPNPPAALATAFGTFARRAAYEIDDLRAAVSEVRPDVVIVDANCWGAAAAAEVSGIPWVSFWPYVPYLPSRDVPPFGPGLRPLAGPVGALRDAVLRATAGRMMEKLIMSELAPVRRSAGAPPVATVEEFLRRAPLTLVATAEPFEYPRSDWGPDVHLIGACAFDPMPAATPDWLAAIEEPIVLVTTSSEHQGDDGLARAALAALAGEPVHVVVTMPAGVPTDIDVPPNATLCEFVSHSPVLDRAICVVSHGGMGATQKALSRGIPVCVVPHGRDQFEVARRVEVSRSGTRLPAKRLTPNRLRARVRRASTMADGARRVAQGFARAGGPTRGAELVEQRLLNRTASEPPRER